MGELLGPDAAAHRRLFFEPPASSRRLGARVDPDDPLAVLALGKSAPRLVGRRGGGRRGGAGRRRGRGRDGSAREHGSGPGSDAGHDRQRDGAGRGDGARRRRAAGHGSDEDGARDPGARQRDRPRDRRHARRHGLRGPCPRLHRGDVARARGRDRGRGDRPRCPPSRPGRGGRAAGEDPRCRPARRGGPAAEDGPADGAREHRRALRRGLVRRVRLARDRGAAAAEHGRGADRQHAGGRAGDGRGPRERAPVPGHEVALRRDVVRLHGAGRHPGQEEPPEEGPDVQAGRAGAAAHRLLHGGRRGTPGRYRPGLRRQPSHAGVQHVRPAERAGAARGHHLGPVLRGQCRDPRMLRRRHRDGEREHRHGRAGHDRGRRPRRVPAGRGRADERADAERRGRHRGGRRGRGGARGAAVPVLLPGRDARLDRGRPAPPAPRGAGEPPARVRRAIGADHAGRHGLGARAAARLRRGDDHGPDPRRGPARRRRREQPDAPRRRHRQRRGRQGRAVHAALRRLRHPAALPVRHAGQHGRARGRADRAGAALLPALRHRRQRHGAVLHRGAAQGLWPRRAGHGGRRLPRARSSRCPGPPASSAAWGSRAR